MRIAARCCAITPRQAQGLVAVARSILVIVWHLLADPAARFSDLGSGYHASRTDKNRKTPQPRPPARSPRLPGHPDRRRLTSGQHGTPQPAPARVRCRAPS